MNTNTSRIAGKILAGVLLLFGSVALGVAIVLFFNVLKYGIMRTFRYQELVIPAFVVCSVITYFSLGHAFRCFFGERLEIKNKSRFLTGEFLLLFGGLGALFFFAVAMGMSSDISDCKDSGCIATGAYLIMLGAGVIGVLFTLIGFRGWRLRQRSI